MKNVSFQCYEILEKINLVDSQFDSLKRTTSIAKSKYHNRDRKRNRPTILCMGVYNVIECQNIINKKCKQW